MARMTRSLVTPYGLAAMLFCAVAVGCGPSEKDLKIEQLTSENGQLKDELDARDRQLNDAVVREQEARDTIEQLNRDLVKFRAGGDQTPGPDGWIKTASFDMISIPGSVLFASGKSDLTSDGRQTLSRVAADITSRYGDRDIYVFGHTDNEPIRKSKWKDNWQLGASRALSVIRELRNRGVTNESLIQANCAEYRPKASNASTSGRAQNRRVEVFAVRRNNALIENSTASGYSDD